MSGRGAAKMKQKDVQKMRWIAGTLLLCLTGGYSISTSSASEAISCGNKAREKVRIMLDVGHTPSQPGAISARGETEYSSNLRLAIRMKDELASAGFQTRLLTISQQGPSGLLKRADDANSWPADLFLSIHHDSVQPGYFKTWLFEGKVRPYSDDFRGYSVFVSKENGAPEQSGRLANAVANHLMQAGMSFTTHHAEPIKGEGRTWLDPSRGIYQFDELSVLRRTKMP